MRDAFRGPEGLAARAVLMCQAQGPRCCCPQQGFIHACLTNDGGGNAL